ncbi:phage tail tape measure protein [Enterococcus ureilyticus]|uniref:phage tail tape measure protein n=1 Tax=Enterococcus ureilyticus TaxID=1131292 RepID=UPI001A93660A|nr:phage tail tape measure protein [Enterococcus ureilyticus]MBO0445549.1 phage tail tape measure protein [Enterococcus ureilyticus]
MGAAGTPIGNMVIKLGLDDSDFGRGVENSKKQVRYLAKEMQANMKIADMAGNQMDKLGARYNGLTNIISAQEKQVSSLKKAYEESFVDGKATDSTKRLAAQLQDANGKLAGYKQQLIKTAGSLAEFEVKTTGATGAIYAGSEKMISAGKRMESVGGSMTKGLTVPILAGAAAVTTAAISWESAFAGVKKTNDEVVDSTGKVVYSYKDLEDGLRGLAKELPASHQEIAAVAEAAGQLGIETPNVVSFTKTMIDLGESTNMSAETAATALARFANITQMSQGDFDKLGSVIVDLGNNFATTESEITEMGLRLAGAGKQIGMSQGEILGFAAALSSVGIEAEAGGSAFSKVMVEMQLAVEKGTGAFSELEQIANNAGYSIGEVGDVVLKGGKPLKTMAESLGMSSKELSKMYKEADKSKTSLENFSQVAGMTGEQFSKAFKEDPSQAIIKFIEGLKNAESQGTSAIKVLDDMDIKEVRLRDSLLRASNASDVFSGAIKMGNKAWGENTALTEEANKRYETTESKLKMLKNEAVDAAIDLGGPFVDALRDGLKASKPLVKMLGELAKAFSDADPKTQQLIVKLLAATAAAGPLLKITGKLTGGIGSLGKSFVELSASMAKKKAITEATEALASGTISTKEFSSAMAGGVGNVTKFGSAAATASGTSGIGAMTAALGPLGPAILGIVGVGGALAVGYGAWKLFGESAYNSARSVQTWGADVDKETSKTLESVRTFSTESGIALSAFEKGATSNATSVKESFNQMATTISTTAKEINEEIDKVVAGMDERDQASGKKRAEEIKKNNDAIVETTRQMNERVAQIYEKHSGDLSKMTETEKEIVISGRESMIQAELNLLELSGKDKKNIMSAINSDITTLNRAQLREMNDSLQKALEQENKAYKKQAAAYKEQRESGLLDEKTYNTRMAELKSSNLATTQAVGEKLIDVYKGFGYSVDQTRESFKSYGLDYDKIVKNMESSTNDFSLSNSILAKTTKDMSQEAIKASEKWNSLVFDPKTGEIKTNAPEVIQQAASSKEGWEDLKFILKNAELNTNARETVALALGESGKWNSLSVKDKKLVVNNDEALLNLINTVSETGKWNEYKVLSKELGIDNAQTIEKLIRSESDLNRWNQLPVAQKKMLADNTDLLNKVFASEASYNGWSQLPDNVKKMLADNVDLKTKLADGTISLDQFNKIEPLLKSLLGNSYSVDQAAATAGNSLNIFDRNNPAIKNLQGNAANVSNATNQGNNSLNVFARNNPASKYLSAIDQASGPAREANKSVSDFDSQPSVITKTLKVIADIGAGVAKIFGFEKGTNYHMGGPAIVNDQSGPLYKELIIPKGGTPFIAEGRDVLLPDLPRGSKVLNARQTKRLIPHYADGIGVPENSTMIRNLKSYTYETTSAINTNAIKTEDYTAKFDELISIMSKFGSDLANLKMTVDTKVLANVVIDEQNRRNFVNRRRKGDKI